MKNNDIKNLNAIKILGIEMIANAQSGHPGIVLGSGSILYTLFKYHLNFNCKNPKWINRDRFVLSAGHGSALLYSLMFYFGYKINIDDIKNFRQLKSKTSGHPEYWSIPGIEATTGPLGQGIAMAVGMSLTQKWLGNNHYLTYKNDLYNHYVYCLCGDGDLQEGISYESMSLAGKWKLKNLIILYASNDIQLDGKTTDSFSENMKKRVESQNFNYFLIKNGNDIDLINKTIKKAKTQKNGKPNFIEIKTIIGKDTLLENSSKVHGLPLNQKNIDFLYKKLGWTHKKFKYDKNIQRKLSKILFERSNEKYLSWLKKYKKYDPKKTNNQILISKIIKNIKLEPESTRVICGKIFKNIYLQYDLFIGGSADLSSSTKIMGKNGFFSHNNLAGQEIKFGVREFAMSAIINGITLHSFLRGYCSTFLVFSDYAKAAIRLAAIMNICSLFIFSHDSVFIGEDGPTHQPIEQITSLRSIINLNVWRPANVLETAYILKNVCSNKNSPNAIITSRQVINVPNYPIKRSDIEKGGYIFYETNKKADFIIFASGSELENAYNITKKIEEEWNKSCQIISVPCLDLLIQNQKYLNTLINNHNAIKIAIEASNCPFWFKIIGKDGLFFGIKKYGYSAKINDLKKNYLFTLNSIFEQIKKNYINKYKKTLK